jgi:non-homologous end joining protein Ku
VAPQPEEQREQIIDLVAALKQSLAAKKTGAPAEAKPERKAARAKGRKAG